MIVALRTFTVPISGPISGGNNTAGSIGKLLVIQVKFPLLSLLPKDGRGLTQKRKDSLSHESE